MQRRRLGALVAMTLLLGAACGDEDGEGSSGTTTSSVSATTTEASPTTTDPGPLPGERVEIFPYEDAELGVVGVEVDDTLNLRAGPDVSYDVVAELEPLADGLVATGHNRQLEGDGFWAEVTFEGDTGWANVRFLAHLGQVDDITSQIAPDAADRPSAATMEGLGRKVGQLRASDEPPSRIVIVDGPHQDDVSEVTVDVIGLGDDSVAGERLHVFAVPDENGFTIRTVEATTLCSRGVTDEGLCV